MIKERLKYIMLQAEKVKTSCFKSELINIFIICELLLQPCNEFFSSKCIRLILIFCMAIDVSEGKKIRTAIPEIFAKKQTSACNRTVLLLWNCLLSKSPMSLKVVRKYDINKKNTTVKNVFSTNAVTFKVDWKSRNTETVWFWLRNMLHLSTSFFINLRIVEHHQ